MSQTMQETIRNNAHGCAFAAGSLSDADVARTAEEWEACGFTPAQAEEWLASGCFDAAAADTLANSYGLRSDQVAGNCPELPGYSWGYAYANGDVTAEDVVAACERG